MARGNWFDWTPTRQTMPECPGCWMRPAMRPTGIFDVHFVVGVDLDRDVLAENFPLGAILAMA